LERIWGYTIGGEKRTEIGVISKTKGKATHPQPPIEGDRGANEEGTPRGSLLRKKKEVGKSEKNVAMRWRGWAKPTNLTGGEGGGPVPSELCGIGGCKQELGEPKVC